MTIRRRLLRFMRKLHIWVGLSAALYFMLIAATGVMINHREGLRLDERNVSRTWLPNGYRTQDGSAVRADIVVKSALGTDLARSVRRFWISLRRCGSSPSSAAFPC